MPQITDADVAKVKSLIAAHDIVGARKLLKTFDGPRADKLLANLNERYPVSSPAPTIPLAPRLDPNVDRAKILIQKKKYAEAKKLLLTSDDPRADMLLRRINDADEMNLKAKDVHNRRPWMRTPCLVLLVLIIFLPIVGCYVVTAGTFRLFGAVAEDLGNINDEGQRTALIALCKTTFQGRSLTPAALQTACEYEAEFLHLINASAVKECYTRKPNDPSDFAACFVEKGLAFSGTNITVSESS